MTYNLTVVDHLVSPMQGMSVVITRTSDSVQEFSGTTNSSGLVSATLTNSTQFSVELTKSGTRLYRRYYVTTGTVTVNTTFTVSVDALLNFTGATFKGSYPANNLSLKFICGCVVTKKESSLNFWGSSAKEMDKSVIKYQVL